MAPRSTRLTEQCVLEHGVRLDLVQRCFEEALLLELIIVIVVIDTAELLSLFV